MNQEMHMSSAWVIHFFCKLILSDFFNKWNRDEKQEMWMIIFFPERFPLWKKWTNAWKQHYSILRVHFFFLEKGSLSWNLTQGKYFAPKIGLWKGKPSNTTFSRYGGTNTPVWAPPLQKSLLIKINALYCNDLALNQLSIILSSFYDKVNVYHLKA